LYTEVTEKQNRHFFDRAIHFKLTNFPQRQGRKSMAGGSFANLITSDYVEKYLEKHLQI